MALEHPRLLAASLIAGLVGTSCSTPSDTTNTPTPGPRGPAAAQPDPEGQEPGVTQQDRNLHERRAALVAKYLQNARALRSQGDLQAAKHELLRANELSPGNQEAVKLLTAVQAELGEPASEVVTLQQEQVRQQQIAEERARLCVQTQLQKAAGLAAEMNYAGAQEELRIAALTIELKDEIDWQDLPQRVASMKTEVERLFDEQAHARQAAESEVLAERLRAEDAAAEARRREQHDTLILEAQKAFEAQNFPYSRELASKAMAVDPHSTLAVEMHNAAVKAARENANRDYYQDRALRMRQLTEADEELRRPQTEILELDPGTWALANSRAARGATAIEIDPQDQAVWDQVDQIQVGKLTYTEETGAYLDVVKNLSLITGLQIIVTPEARAIIDSESLVLTIELVGQTPVRDFLDYMIGRSAALAWTVKNGCVLIGDKSQAAGTLDLIVYPVRDIILPRTQFLPPRIRDIPGEEFEDVPRTGGEGEDPVSYIEIADLETMVRTATDPTYWESEGVEIRAEDTGFLAIKASPEMHAQVRRVLNDMRRFATPIVTIDSKFLTISRNFLQEVGVDIRGLGGSGNPGDTVALDDVTNGLQSNASQGLDNGGTGDPAANPLAGAFYNDGGDGDVRARTENYFANDLSRVLSPSGGLTAGWTLLDDTQLNMILRAVEKQQDIEVVNSQILSVLNRERGHVAVINQTAYVRDFDVEVAQASFIADPKVDVIQDGIVLDVQPVIQHDRKYIILNLNPTVAELTRPIPTFTTSLAGSTLPVTLQLPNLVVTNFSTTVKVPDGGTVLLGGLRQVLTKERRAEVPLLARLPLISFLFKQESSADENKSLMVMVRATITDVVEDAIK
jgi:type II secretory pathway component GspD/PulD (secretin)